MIVAALACAIVLSSEDLREVGAELRNPVPPMVNAPTHLDFDGNIGSSAQGTRWTLEAKPVLPMAISSQWLIAARSIIKIEAQRAVTAPNEGQTGLADLTEGLYLSPRRPFGGWFQLALGATTSLPTATARAFGDQRVSAGPSVLLRIKPGHFTVSLLTGWVGSLGNDGGSVGPVSQLSLEGEASYTTATAWNVSLSTTTTFNTINSQWVAPFTAALAKVLPLSRGQVAVGGGVRVYLDPLQSSPQFGARLEVTWLLPEQPTP
jgi:hypothetical protein